MLFRIIADITVLIHFALILFILYGFVLTVAGFWIKGFWERFWFRTIHLAGILVVAGLAATNRYCPITIFENMMRSRHDPDTVYPGSFIVHYVERLVYPDVHPMMIVVPTIIIALYTLAMYVIIPPKCGKRIRRH